MLISIRYKAIFESMRCWTLYVIIFEALNFFYGNAVLNHFKGSPCFWFAFDRDTRKGLSSQNVGKCRLRPREKTINLDDGRFTWTVVSFGTRACRSCARGDAAWYQTGDRPPPMYRLFNTISRFGAAWCRTSPFHLRSICVRTDESLTVYDKCKWTDLRLSLI